MITIIGAGPAGSYLAYLLSKKGKEVTLIEERDKIGSPVQCTGIVTGSIEKFVKLKNNVIVKRLSKVIVVSKNNKTEAEVDEIVMWRNKFDEFMAEKAQDEGVKILINRQFLEFSGRNSLKIRDKKNRNIKEIKSDFIIGADGPSSAVAKAANMNLKNNYYIGIQAKVKLNMDTNAF